MNRTKLIVSVGLLAALITLTGCKKKDQTPATRAVAPTSVMNTATKSPTETPPASSGNTRYDVTGMGEAEMHDLKYNPMAHPAVATTDETVIVKNARFDHQRNECGEGGCNIADLDDFNDLSTAQKKSESVKGMLRKIPVIGGTASAENSLMSGGDGNYNELKLPRSSYDVKLPGSGHSDLPAARKGNLWPGGIPLEAEIAPEIMDD